MFRLQRHRSSKSGEKIDFRFSKFQASQVPKGWDKLFVSIISVETGKTIAKSSKAVVRNGTCQWPESLSESIWISHDASKDLEECLFKIVVSMGSARAGILGEATVNLTDFMSPGDPGPISLPLKKSAHGTILQVKIQCLNQKTKFRKGSASNLFDPYTENDDMDNKSDGSDISFNRSIGSSSGNHLGSTSHPDELGNRDLSFSGSGSHRSSDSGESLGRTILSPGNNLSRGSYNHIGRQDSAGSQIGGTYISDLGDEVPRSNQSSLNSRTTGSGIHYQNQWHELAGQNSSHSLAPSSLRNKNSSKDLLEAAEHTIEDLRAEAKMWENNARKTKIDLDKLKKDLADQSRNRANLDMKLSMACSERDSLRQEIEKMKLSVEELTTKQSVSDNSSSPSEDLINLKKELEDELKFQKESSTNLALQLKKSQEANLELISILQELEETIEKQGIEIVNLSEKKDLISGTDESRRLDLHDESLVKNLQKGFANPEDCNVEAISKKWDGNSGVDYHHDLPLQLHELQESESKLQCVVKSLEKSLEEKDHQIKLAGSLKDQALHNKEVEWANKLSLKEKEIAELETKLSNLVDFKALKDSEISRGGDSDLIKEVEDLRIKVQELERDCNELTDENLELMYKMKESEKDSVVKETSTVTALDDSPVSASSGNAESEISLLKYHLEGELKNAELLNDGNVTESLQIQVGLLQKKHTALELELQHFKDKASDLDAKLCQSLMEVEEKGVELTVVRSELENFHGTIQNKEILIILSNFYNQLLLTLSKVKNAWHGGICSDVFIESESFNLMNSGSEDPITPEKVKTMVDKFLELNNILEAKYAECKDMFTGSDIREQDAQLAEAQKNLEEYVFKEQELKHLNDKLQLDNEDINQQLVVKRTEIDLLKSGFLLKEEDVLRNSQRESETLIASLLKDKNQLEKDLETALRGSSITSKCLDDVQQDMMVLTSSMETRESASKILERKSMELESSECELELHISELEQENVQLSERVSGLEAQLRYYTHERESNHLEVENSRRLVIDLRDQIERLGIEMEMLKVEHKERLQDFQKKLSEAQEQSEFSKRAQVKLQATIENLIEEYSSLQELTGDLRRQKLEMHEHCAHIEIELRESQKKNYELHKKVEILEFKLSSLNKNVEQFHSHAHPDNFSHARNLCDEVPPEKMVVVGHLQTEVTHFTAELVPVQYENGQLTPEGVPKVSILHPGQSELEDGLNEVHSKAWLVDTESPLESESKSQGSTGIGTSSKLSDELLVADLKHMQIPLEGVESSEPHFTRIVNELEIKLKASEYEKQQLTEEIWSLKDQLQKIVHLQDEILDLRNSLDETKFEKVKLEASLQTVSSDCEELKVERISFVDKLSRMKKDLTESEDARRRMVALEEKVLLLEGDLSARDALSAQDAELKNELSRMKRANSQFKRKIQSLEEEKDEYLKRAQELEKELKLRKDEKQSNEELTIISNSKRASDFSDHKNEAEENINGHSDVQAELIKKIKQLQALQNCQENQVDQGNSLADKKPHDQIEPSEAINLGERIHMLEIELAEALETNNMYKQQLKSFLSERQVADNDAHERPSAEVVQMDGHRRRTSSLEAELKDLRERYFNMSIKYAQVEAEREELVMKLKTPKKERRWFS